MSAYLDCAATTPLEPRVRDVVLRYLEEDYGNAASRGHDFGTNARRAVEKARDQVAAVVAASRGEVVFTGGGTWSRRRSSTTRCWSRWPSFPGAGSRSRSSRPMKAARFPPRRSGGRFG